MTTFTVKCPCCSCTFPVVRKDDGTVTVAGPWENPTVFLDTEVSVVKPTLDALKDEGKIAEIFPHAERD
jgi:hypothetical protein